MSEFADNPGKASPQLLIPLRQPAPRGVHLSIVEVQTFAFIDTEDKDGTRRARSHAGKEFRRRQKATGQRYQHLKDSKSKKGIAAKPSAHARIGNPLTGSNSSQAMVLAAPLVLPTPVNMGNSVDPFSNFPAKLNSVKDLGLIHHYHNVFVPRALDAVKNDFTNFRKLIFDICVKDSAAFLLIVSAAAEDIAVRSKKSTSQQMVVYRARSLSILNARPGTSEEFTSDGSISAYVLLAGIEILHGSVESYATHMDGVCSVLKARGGFDVLQKQNPLLCAFIAWIDFGAAGVLLDKRRFEATSCDDTAFSSSRRPLRFTPPINSSRNVLFENDTLYDNLMTILGGLEHATSMSSVGLGSDSRHAGRHAAFLMQIDNDLLRTLTLPLKPSNMIRRILIEDCYRLSALIYLSAAPHCIRDSKLDCEIFLPYLYEKLIDPSTGWGQSSERILRLLMDGQSMGSQVVVYHVMQLMDVSVTMGWDAWKSARDLLLDYLLHAEICTGMHQDIWTSRMAIAEE